MSKPLTPEQRQELETLLVSVDRQVFDLMRTLQAMNTVAANDRLIHPSIMRLLEAGYTLRSHVLVLKP